MNGTDQKRILERLAEARSAIDNATFLARVQPEIETPKPLIIMAVGFVFSENMHRVLLQRKGHPARFAGKYNGIGGRVEKDDQSYAAAMAREFDEETLHSPISPKRWRLVAQLRLQNGMELLNVFYATLPHEVLSDIEFATRLADEPCIALPTWDVCMHSAGERPCDVSTLQDVPTLVSLCVAHASVPAEERLFYDITVRPE